MQNPIIMQRRACSEVTIQMAQTETFNNSQAVEKEHFEGVSETSQTVIDFKDGQGENEVTSLRTIIVALAAKLKS